MKYILYRVKQVLKQIFTYPVTSISLDNVDYDKYWQDKRGKKLGVLSNWQKQRADITVKYLKKVGTVSVVDIGCGDGSMLKYIKDRCSISKATGVDISKSALEKAEEFGLETIQLDIGNGNLQEIPRADFFLLFEVLEHIHSSETFLKSILEKSNNGVFFSFPNSGYFTYRLRLLFGKFPLQWRIHPGEHVRFWTLTDLRWWLKALGYSQYKIHFYEGVPFLNRLWPSLFAAGLFVHIPKK